jgi:hypothetical protein
MDYIKTEYTSDEEPNLCMECGIDMGPMNPRQLCGKWHCLNIAFLDYEEENTSKGNDEPDRKKVKTDKD